MEVITGVLFHSVGASSAALCYTPQKKVVQWSWQTYWLAQALVCWLLLPVIIAWITIPEIETVLREAPAAAMRTTFLLGMAYGIGGTAFGIAIRYVGFSLTYAIAVGISCVLGTLLPPLVAGELSALFEQKGAEWIITGVGLGVLGIALCGLAGRYKEIDLEKITRPVRAFRWRRDCPSVFWLVYYRRYMDIPSAKGSLLRQWRKNMEAAISGAISFISFPIRALSLPH